MMTVKSFVPPCGGAAGIRRFYAKRDWRNTPISSPLCRVSPMRPTKAKSTQRHNEWRNFLAKRAHLSTLQVRKALDPYNDLSVSNKSYKLCMIKILFIRIYPEIKSENLMKLQNIYNLCNSIVHSLYNILHSIYTRPFLILLYLRFSFSLRLLLNSKFLVFHIFCWDVLQCVYAAQTWWWNTCQYFFYIFLENIFIPIHFYCI